MLDDTPLRLRTREVSIARVPRTQECNDVPMMPIQHRPAGEWRDRAIVPFDQLRRGARNAPHALARVVRPDIKGAPHRACYLRKALACKNANDDALWMTGSSILDHWKV